MNRFKDKAARILSVILAVIMTLSILPIGVVAKSDEYPDDLTFIVSDGAQVLDGVSISYVVLINDYPAKTATTETNGDGVAVVSAMTNFVEEFKNGEKITISYETTKEGYESKSGSHKVENLNDTISVVMGVDGAEKEKVTVSASTSGSGSGKIIVNNQEMTENILVEKSSEISIIVNADELSYIESISINGEERIASGKKEYSETITIEENMVIAVTFVKQYSVSVIRSKDGGSVKLDEEVFTQETAEKLYDAGSELILNVEADEGYQIFKITVDGKEKELGEADKYNEKITINADMMISVEFIKVYTINISYDGDKGEVDCDPKCVGGTAVVKTGSTLLITAVPGEKYRVAKVSVSGKDDEIFDTNIHNHSNPYKTSLNVDKDYEIEIVFEELLCSIKVNKPANGTANVSLSEITKGGTAVVSFTPDDEYVLDYIKINGKKLTADELKELVSVMANEKDYQLTLSDINEDKDVEIAFKMMENGKINDIRINSKDALRYIDSENKYIYGKNGEAVLSSEYKFKALKGLFWSEKTESLSIKSDTTISKFRIWYDSIFPSKIDANNLKIVFDTYEPKVTLTPDKPNGNGYYKNNVDINIDVVDEDESAGLETVEYYIESDGVKSEVNKIFSYAESGKVETKFNKRIVVDASVYNSDSVKVYVTVTDRAGNTKEETVSLKINSTAPKIKSIKIDGTLKENADTGFYSDSRTVIVTLEDRKSCFDEQAFIISFEDSSIAIPQVSWSDGTEKDEHIGMFVLSQEVAYKWDATYTNKASMASNKASEATEIDGASAFDFIIDKTAPTGTIKAVSRAWNKLVSFITFGLWSNQTTDVVTEVNDNLAGEKSVQYYKADTSKALTADELDDIEFKDSFEPVENDDDFVVYAKITDKAGWVTYIGTNGIIVDKSNSKIEITKPEANAHGYYNKDVTLDISVDDEKSDSVTYSGIKEIRYEVFDGNPSGKATQSGTFFKYDFKLNSDDDKGTLNVTDWDSDKQTNKKGTSDKNVVLSKDDLQKTWSGKLVINTAENKNNSDDVNVRVIAVDNAGNETVKECHLKINVSKPTIKVEFNDKANTVIDEHGYFGHVREATISIIDRNSCFDEKAATEGIVFSEMVNAKGEKVEATPVISSWTSDDDVHTATVTFPGDANYKWSLSYTNYADNSNDGVDTAKSVTPFDFTVDLTDPTGSISIEENVWTDLRDILLFRFKDRKVDVKETADDETSPVIVKYYKTSDPEIKTAEQLDKINNFADFEGSSLAKDGVSPEEQFVVYLKVMDYSGNYIYLNSDGYIIDSIASDITISPEESNHFCDNGSGTYGTYNKDVNVSVNVKDRAPYSGIKTIDYWVEVNGQKTQEGNLFSFTKTVAEYKELVSEKNCNFTVKKENNSCDTMVYVKTVDNAGNESTKSIKLDIDIVAPVITIRFDNNKDNNGNTYFNATRTATITIKERTHHFNAAEATQSITVTAVDVKGNAIADAYNISGWTTNESSNPDETTHTATVAFAKDANYTFGISYENATRSALQDEADNVNQVIDVDGQTAPFKFTVDTTAPVGTVTAKSAEEREETWSDLVESLTFGFWSKSKISISSTSDDITSPIESVEYYMPKATNASDNTTALKASDLDSVKSWSAFDGLDVGPNNQFTVYIKITDKAGNYKYVGTNGLIVDDQHPNEESVAPEISVTPEKPINGIYNSDVKVDIKIVDPLTGGTYSGLKNVTYKIFDRDSATPDVPTQQGTLFEFQNENPKQSELQQTFTSSITVESAKNNSNNVQIVVTSTDNAGNYIDNADSAAQSYTVIKVDTTAPTIDVSYDNNTPDNKVFFKHNRTATISITERNFNKDDVKVTITNTDGKIPAVVGWNTTEGNLNKDNSKHVAKITYSADGDYTFAIEYTDLAGNKCKTVKYATGTVAAEKFTIDKTIPTISVRYNNNEVSNGKYFKNARIATVTIKEHNFDVNRVKFTIESTLNGSAIAKPAISWQNNGNTHTATISYNRDGDYTFKVEMSDKAGNKSKSVDYGNSQAATAFTVDTKIEKPVIKGVANGKSYSGTVVPSVSFSDINYASYDVKLYRTRKNEKNLNVTKQFIRGINTGSTGGSASFDTFKKSSSVDGIYTLVVSCTDKAGNKESSTCTFTVNRFGSVYVYDDYLSSIIKDGGMYIKSKNGEAINKDLTITEFNPDKIKEGTLNILITRDGQAIKAKYTTNPELINKSASVGSSGWYEYLYTISKSNFKKDGLYKITVMSEDTAGNKSTSVPANTNDAGGNKVYDVMSFTVDTTAPQIRNIINLDEAIVNANKLTVKYSIVDVGGLSKIEVFYGNQYATINKFTDRNSYTGEFTLNESTEAQAIRIKVTDLAGNVTDTSSENFDPGNLFVFNDPVTVSTNAFVRWYANKVLFYGTIGGFLALVAASFIIIFAVRNKKRDEE